MKNKNPILVSEPNISTFQAKTANNASHTQALNETGIASGTQILTREGLQPVDLLEPEDQIVTPQGTFANLLCVKCYLLNSRPMMIRRNSLGDNTPSQHLLLAPLQPIYLHTTKYSTDGIQRLLKFSARSLLNGRDIIEVPAAGGFKMFQLWFENSRDFFADGVRTTGQSLNDNR